MEAIVILPILAGIGLIFWSSIVKEEYPLLSLMLQFMFLPLILLSIHLAVIEATLVYAANTQLVTTLTSMVEYLGWLIFGVGGYFAFIILGKILEIVQQKKKDKEERKYND